MCLLGMMIAVLIYLFCLPAQPFNKPTSTVLFDSHGELLAARIATDQQWRFAPSDSIPPKLETCLLAFEDKNFYHHIGISLKGVVRAIKQNIQRGKIVSGGSTITMQVVRMMRHNPPRTFTEKFREMILATRMECRYSKKEILRMYFSNAPFGNNVVGLSAASWRYYGKRPEHLSWAESATLAVLPNAPGLIYPGKNHDRLLNKRNRLLNTLLLEHQIDSVQYFLALEEPLPSKPLPLPQSNLHLLQRFIAQGNKGRSMQTTIDQNIQTMSASVIQHHMESLQQNSIHNAAVVITDLKSGNIITYIGNTYTEIKDQHNDVDCANAPRSSGSILKPILYSKCLDEGIILPSTLLPDMPSYFGSFNPKNFNKTYDGAVPANECLTRSLNIPMVCLLNQYGVDKFQHDLQQSGFSSIRQNSTHYGLTLILGGAEVSLLQINKAYSQMALSLLSDTVKNQGLFSAKPSSVIKNTLHKASIYTTFKTLLEVNRPDEEGNWRVFESSQAIAWKTGTSFGNRDAWAVGITPDYVVSVWVGNATGEGRPSLTGVRAAAPILFDLFDKLPKSKTWFKKPETEYTRIPVCRQSGYRIGEACNDIDSISVPLTCLRATACPYHRTVWLDRQKKWRVDADHEERNNMTAVNYFILPPLMQKYYMLKHPDYVLLPPYQNGGHTQADLQIIYPKPDSRIYLPKEMDGRTGKLVCEAVGSRTNEILYWHIDEQFLAETDAIHQQSVFLESGKHTLTIIDQHGNSRSVGFEVMEK